MTTLTVENIPDDLYEKLKESAQAHGRSLNDETIFCLETVLAPRKISISEKLQRVRFLRQQVPPGKVTTAEMGEAINQGRS